MSVMQLALEALDSDNPDIQLRAAIALREKLAQPEHDYRTRYDRGCYKCGSHYCPADCPDPTHLVPQQPLCTSPPKTEQEPVAWLKTWSDGSVSVLKSKSGAFADHELEPLYAAPQKRDLTCVCGAVWDGEMMVHPPKKREWVGLTDAELKPLCDENHIMFGAYTVDFIQAIEAKLKEKNHG